MYGTGLLQVERVMSQCKIHVEFAHNAKTFSHSILLFFFCFRTSNFSFLYILPLGLFPINFFFPSPWSTPFESFSRVFFPWDEWRKKKKKRTEIYIRTYNFLIQHTQIECRVRDEEKKKLIKLAILISNRQKKKGKKKFCLLRKKRETWRCFICWLGWNVKFICILDMKVRRILST